eukprot:4144890-Pleurochrysis_carterae.AAC.1
MHLVSKERKGRSSYVKVLAAPSPAAADSASDNNDSDEDEADEANDETGSISWPGLGDEAKAQAPAAAGG